MSFLRSARLLVCLFAGLVVSGLAAEAQTAKYAPSRPVKMSHMKLELTPDLTTRSAQASVLWQFSALSEVSQLRLNAVGLDIQKVTVNSAPVKFANTGETLLVHFAERLVRGRSYQLAISYAIQNPERGMYFRGPTTEDPNVPYQLWTQGEATEARHWIPGLDYPDQRHSTEVLVTVDRQYQVLSNGKLLSQTPKESTSVWHWKQELTHPVYLVSVVVGQFEVVKEKTESKLELSYYVPPGHKNLVHNSFSNTGKMIDYFNELTGFEYPWDKYAQVVVEQFTFGGMENTSATTLNYSTLHSDRAHLDFSSDGLVAHELAHQWFGDLVTCRDWPNIWLNEGFATYFEALWCEKSKGQDEFEWNMRGKAFPSIHGGRKKPIVDRFYGKPMDLFDSRAYPKGAWTLHQLRRKLGDELFWAGLKQYVKDNQFSAVESDQLRRAFESVSGVSLGLFFHEKLHRAGHPVYQVRYKWREDQKMLEIDLQQTQKTPVFAEPVEICAQIGEKRLIRRVSMANFVGKSQMRVYWPLDSRPEGVCLDPDEKILKELTESKPQDWCLHQLKHGQNVVGRARAVQALSKMKPRPEILKALKLASLNDKFWGVREEAMNSLAKHRKVANLDLFKQWLKDEHSSVRRRAVELLERRKANKEIGATLWELWKQTDPSIRVEAALVTALAKHDSIHAASVIQQALKTDSHRERVRMAGMTALERQQRKVEETANANAISLKEWLKLSLPGNSYYVRDRAFRRLANIAQLKSLDANKVKEILARIKNLLIDDSARMKKIGLNALRSIGRKGAPNKEVVELIAEFDRDKAVRKLAADTLRDLSKPKQRDLQLEQLKARLGKLEKQSNALEAKFKQLSAACKRESSH